jgi:hypothetical protein
MAPWLLAALAGGCAPQIGDQCAVSTDCSVNGDRLCDTTQPGGYCTVFNCQPDSCPGSSVCVAFRDSSCGNTAGRAVRFQRTFCMKSCQGDGDCRSGYTCQDVLSQIVDTNPTQSNVCSVAASTVPPVQDAAASSESPPICLPFDGSFASPSSDGGDASSTDAQEASESSPDVQEAGESASDAQEAGESTSDAQEAGESTSDAQEAGDSLLDAGEAGEGAPDAAE